MPLIWTCHLRKANPDKSPKLDPGEGSSCADAPPPPFFFVKQEFERLYAGGDDASVLAKLPPPDHQSVPNKAYSSILGLVSQPLPPTQQNTPLKKEQRVEVWCPSMIDSLLFLICLMSTGSCWKVSVLNTVCWRPQGLLFNTARARTRNKQANGF